MIVRALNDNRVVKITLQVDEKEFISKNPTGGFALVEVLPKSRHSFWKLKDSTKPLTEDNIIADEERNIQKDIELKQKAYTNNISNMLKAKAKELGFQTFYTASAYLTQTDNPLRANAEKLGVWGGNVWGKSIEIQAQVESGEIEMPETWKDLKAMLPQWED